MIAKYIFEVLLCIHVLGDFYFQTERMAQEKKSSPKALIKHIALYAITGSVLLKVLLPALPLKFYTGSWCH